MMIMMTHRNGLHVDRDGTRYWYLDGLLHRENGPAVEWTDGSREWWHHGELHRKDGPAIERADGTKEWWMDGEQMYQMGDDNGNGNRI